MIITVTDYRNINTRMIMDIYSESNSENADIFFPDETDRDTALRKAEDGFLDYLKNDFFRQPGASCRILEEEGIWVSALRLYMIRNGMYYIEALETRPDRRGKGYASALLSGVIESMKKDGPFRICDCVDKKNAASLRTHEKCGFRIVSDKGYDWLQDEADDRDFGMEYRYDGK